VNQEGMQPDLRIIKDVTNFPITISIINVKAFLGLKGYYKNYIEGYF
jgi:hypothetical protein